MLEEWAAHGTRVAGDEVEYIGWKSYGVMVQLVPVGAALICPKPLAADAVMDPDCPVLRSLSTVVSPCAVSCKVTLMLSPACMNSTSGPVGLPEVAGLNCSGFGGPIGAPLLVRKAKFTYSVPPRICCWHVGFMAVPFTGSCDRLSILSAAHQSRASQLWLANCLTHPGG